MGYNDIPRTFILVLDYYNSMEIIKFDKIRKNLWYVSTMDDGLIGIYTSKRIALAYSPSAGGDSRVQRYSSGSYQYGKGYIQKGSSLHIDEFTPENIKEYNKGCDEKTKYWFKTAFKCHDCGKNIVRYDMIFHTEKIHNKPWFPSEYQNEEIVIE